MTCFRPLSGSYISQCKRKTKGENHEQFPSPIGELHFSIDELIPIARDIQCFRPLSGSYISQYEHGNIKDYMCACFRPLSGSYISQYNQSEFESMMDEVSVPYRGATFLNAMAVATTPATGFRPLSGSYISQYHPRNPMSCLGRIGGLRGKSNFIEIQLFWKVKSSHKSSI